MARKAAAGTAALHGDLLVEIYPRASVVWEGSSDQLIAEGLIPAGLKWPAATARTCWFDGRFESNLCRVPPPQPSDPASAWTSGDWWRLVRIQIFPIRRLHDARVHAKKCEDELLMWRQSEAGRSLASRHRACRADAAFQQFLQAAGITG